MLSAFHINWTCPFFARTPDRPYAVEPFELLTTALSALSWQKTNGSIRMICDSTAKRYYDALGFSFLWDGGVHPLLDAMPEDVNPIAFWAAGKLYALSAMPAPCVMIDTDFIVWKPLAPLLRGLDAAAVHTEDIMPDIYPGPEASPRRVALTFLLLTGPCAPITPRLPILAAMRSGGIIRIPQSALSAPPLLRTTC